MNDLATSPGLADRVARLESRLAIHELLGDFGRAMDQCDEAALRQLLAADVVIRHGPEAPAVTGVDVLVMVLRGLLQKVRVLQHYISNVRVDLGASGDRATALAFVLAMHDTGAGAGGALLPGGGLYRMEVARSGPGGDWQIQSIDVTETWIDPRVITELRQ
ncbi:MAG: nuclear transport factor 2 family protein [Gammaproteobacteria bacterium]|nr:MAG: nuclear transport factor 2 family protein [Gammaproteobacteria bacterium]